MKSVIALALLCLAACAPSSGGFRALNATVTDARLSPTNLTVIQPLDGGTKITLGELTAERWDVKKNGDQFEASVNLSLQGSTGVVRWNQQVSLSGKIETDGSAVLLPTKESKSDLPVRARVTCLSRQNPTDCDQAIIDIFVKEEQKIQAAQYEATLNAAVLNPPTPTNPPTSSTPAPGKTGTSDDGSDPVEGEDTSDQPALYVGTLYQGADSLFSDQPSVKPGASKGKPSTTAKKLDQAVNYAFNGHLENGQNLKNQASQSYMKFVHPERDREWGTNELLKMVVYVSETYKNLSLPPLNVSDLSQKEGGLIQHSTHKSHQNGLDADLGYPLDDPKMLPFANLVKNGTVNPHLQVDKALMVYSAIYKTGLLDRVFVDAAIKKSLCESAQRQGTSDSMAEVLRRLRPIEGHFNHYHLRIQCNKATQPRCRMMGEPPEGSGC